jgi:hypothetical protein
MSHLGVVEIPEPKVRKMQPMASFGATRAISTKTSSPAGTPNQQCNAIKFRFPKVNKPGQPTTTSQHIPKRTTKANGRMHASSSPTTANLPKRELLNDKSAIVSRHLPFAIVLPALEFPSSKCPKILDLGSAGPKPGIHICEGSAATFKAIGEETKNWSTSSFT